MMDIEEGMKQCKASMPQCRRHAIRQGHSRFETGSAGPLSSSAGTA